VVFSFFRKGKGGDEPQTMVPPKPAVPKGAAVPPVQPTAEAEPVPATEQEAADWDDLLYDMSVATAESHSVIEEAAILYANERVAEAIAALRNFLKENPDSRDLQPWLLLFDLYQSQGMKQQFDELSMEFVVRFERSAPVWEGTLESRPAGSAQAKPAKSGGMITLKNDVGDSAEAEIHRLLKLAEGESTVRLDVSQVTGIDSSRAKLLGDVLMMIRKSGKRLSLAGGKELTAVVKALTDGDGRQEQAYWRLLFELYEFQNRVAEFEDAAVDYAVTFEVSPPSWEPLAQGMEAVEETAVQETAAAPVQADVFELDGVISGASEHRLKELERYAEGRTEVRVDMRRTVRVDFMSVGTVISTLIALNQAGKKITISGQNEMIHALFEVMGVRDFATLVRRKAR
jgi:anti-anti-sigma regulatory factor